MSTKTCNCVCASSSTASNVPFTYTHKFTKTCCSICLNVHHGIVYWQNPGKPSGHRQGLCRSTVGQSPPTCPPGLHRWNTVRTRPVAPLPGTSPVQPAQTALSLAPPHCSSKSFRAPSSYKTPSMYALPLARSSLRAFSPLLLRTTALARTLPVWTTASLLSSCPRAVLSPSRLLPPLAHLLAPCTFHTCNCCHFNSYVINICLTHRVIRFHDGRADTSTVRGTLHLGSTG